MPRLLPSSKHALRDALRLTPAPIAISAGLRAAVGATLPMLLLPRWPHPELVWTSLAGFSAVLIDKGGAYRTRALTIGSYTLFGALAAVAGTLASTHPFVSFALVLAWVTVCGFVRLFGADATGVGVSVAVTLVVALAIPSASVPEALARGGYSLIGGAWAALISLMLWPVHPLLPARAAVSDALRELSGFCHAEANTPRDQWPRVRSTHVAQMRESIERARSVLGAARRGRNGPTSRGIHLLLLIEGTDQLYGWLIALEDLQLTPEEDAHREALYRQLNSELLALAELTRRSPSERPHSESRLVTGPWPERLRPSAQRVRAELDGLWNAALGKAPPSATVEPVDPRDSWRDQVRANLTLDSAVMRHALRMSICTAAVVLIVKTLKLHHGYWASLTCLVVLQPWGTATLAKALQRVGGTLLGAGLAILVATFVRDPTAMLALIFLFAAVSVALLPLNYGAYAIFLTPSFVLLAEMGSPEHLESLRVENTLIGAAIALVGSRLLFPVSERDQFPQLMAEAIRRARALLLTLAERPKPAALREGRSRAARTLHNAEASFQRLLTEGGPTAEADEAMAALLVYSHRVLSGLNALAAEEQAVLAERAGVTQTLSDELERLATAIEDQRPQPAMPSIPRTQHARLDRLAEELALQQGAANRWLSEVAAGRPT